MNASTLMLLAIGASLIGSWAHNKKVTIKGGVEALFAVVVVAALDHGETEVIAQGISGLFLVAVLLGSNSPLDGIVKVINKKDTAAK